MDRMRRITIIWGLTLFFLVGGLTVYALSWKNENSGYKSLEDELKNTVEGYFESKYAYPLDGDTVKITLEELQENELLLDFKVKEDICDGYVNVFIKNDVVNYNPYIKCENYTTKGY